MVEVEAEAMVVDGVAANGGVEGEAPAEEQEEVVEAVSATVVVEQDRGEVDVVEVAHPMKFLKSLENRVTLPSALPLKAVLTVPWIPSTPGWKIINERPVKRSTCSFAAATCNPCAPTLIFTALPRHQSTDSWDPSSSTMEGPKWRPF